MLAVALSLLGYKSAYSVDRMHDMLPIGSMLKCLNVCVCVCVCVFVCVGYMRADGAPASEGKHSCGLAVLTEV